MSKMPDSFLEDEVREGFYIPSEIKQAWATELDVLTAVDDICRRHHIKYFAEWGTLLGAVRHSGFIPWDDDLDIAMKREDYEHFLQVAADELPEEYCIINYRNQKEFWHFIARVANRNRISYEKEALRKNHNFPYIAGLDIFVLDNVSDDKDKEDLRSATAKYVIAAADEIAEKNISPIQQEEYIKKIEEICHTGIDRKLQGAELRKRLYEEAEKLFMLFAKEKCEYLTQLMPDGLYGHTHMLKQEYYDEMVYVPFEDTQIPLPLGYDEMLCIRYGDYMNPIHNAGSHDYPFFVSQQRELERISDVALPVYQYSEAQLKHPESNVQDWKELASESIEGLYQLYEFLQRKLENGLWVQAEEILRENQQLAIDLGTLIEEVKGEGHQVVKSLEDYCEQLFLVYQEILHIQNDKTENQKLYQLLESLSGQLSQIKELTLMMTHRREIVFLPFKAQHWGSFESVWKKAMEDINCDVFVVPIPYYFKDYDGTLIEKQYDISDYPDEVQTISYESFDFTLHHPDVIFIQNPYNQYHATMSVPPFFYSENLHKFTDKLVYMPYFVLKDFTKKNEREYANMKFYCTLPGVIQADEVIVQSPQMKQVYIEKLTEFAGENTRKIWEEKITFEQLLQPNQLEQNGENKISSYVIPESWKPIILKPDGTKKKVVLFYLQFCSFIEKKDFIIDKIKSVLEIFQNYREDVALILRPYLLENVPCEISQTKEYHEYQEIIRQYEREGWGILDCSESDEAAKSISDMYYGAESRLMREFVGDDKMAMLHSIETYPMVFENFIVIDEDIWFTAIQTNGLFKYNLNEDKAEFVGSFPGERNRERMYFDITRDGNKLIFTPFSAEAIVIFDMDTNAFTSIPIKPVSTDCNQKIKYGEERKFSCCAVYDHCAYLFPCTYPAIIKIDLQTYELTYLYDFVDNVCTLIKHENSIFFRQGQTDGKYVYLWCVAAGILVKFNMEQGNYEIPYELQTTEKYISAFWDGLNFWLLPSDKGAKVLRVSKDYRTTIAVVLPAEIEYEDLPFLNAAKIEEDIWLFPGAANRIVKINVHSNKCEVVSELGDSEVWMEQKNKTLWKYYATKLYEEQVILYENMSFQLIFYNYRNQSIQKQKLYVKEQMNEKIMLDTIQNQYESVQSVRELYLYEDNRISLAGVLYLLQKDGIQLNQLFKSMQEKFASYISEKSL